MRVFSFMCVISLFFLCIALLCHCIVMQTCPIGGNCTGGTTIDALPVATGYWRSSDNATDIQKCLVASVCVGGTYRDGRAVNTYAPVAFAVVGAGDALSSVCARVSDCSRVGCIPMALLHLH
jgi:hypothetical protein